MVDPTKKHDQTIKLPLTRVESTSGEFEFIAKSITSEFIEPEALEMIARDSINKSMVWRHKHPINENDKSYPIFGKVLDSKVVGGSIISRYSVYGHSKIHQELRMEISKSLERSDPLSISLRFRKYYDRDGNVKHVDVLEHSITPFPACSKCNILEIERGEKTMSEKADEELEMFQEIEQRLTEKESTLESFKAQVTELESKLIAKTDEVKSKEIMLEEQRKSFEEKFRELEQKVALMSKQPVIDKILEIEGHSMLTEIYESKPLCWLEKRLEEVKEKFNASIPSTKPISESAGESIQESTLEEEDSPIAYKGIEDMINRAQRAAKRNKEGW